MKQILTLLFTIMALSTYATESSKDTLPEPTMKSEVEMIKQYKLGAAYLKGDEVEANSKKSFSHFKKAAKLGHAKSQFNLGVFYTTGTGVRENEDKAFYWFEKAAQQGDEKAQHNVGTYYAGEVGCDVSKDKEKHEIQKQNMTKAFYWWYKAAIKGFVDSEFQAGCCYLDGYGVEKDKIKAQEWLIKAANKGHEQAIRLLKSEFN